MLVLILLHFVLAALTPALCRVWGARAFYALALGPAAAFAWVVAQSPTILAGGAVSEGFEWIGALGVSVVVRMGLVQWILALIVTGVGTLILIYCRWYWVKGAHPRSASVLTAFAGAMLGLVVADDLVLLYVCWELTTVFSYLLIGHDNTRRANRSAALTALLVTTAGGLSMLAGLLSLGFQAGTLLLSEIVAAPPTGPIVGIAGILILIGALSKSALIPFQFWLPGAMAAPTPISAYLHAAAMVKAGVYLVLVMAPLFAENPAWRVTVIVLGVLTMVNGGWRSLRQTDLKLVLAYGTVSQLGFMVLLAGLGTRSAALAALAVVVAHALYKSTLFLVVGIIDHNAGTRDLRELSGVGRRLPVLATVAGLAAASMAGLPPLFGFLAKEAALGAFTNLLGGGDIGLPPAIGALLVAAVVLGSTLTVAYALRFWWGAFARKPRIADSEVAPARAGFLTAPAVLATAGLVLGFLGHPVTDVFAPYAAPFAGEESHGLALWHGFTLPLGLSVLALALGAVLFWQRDRITAVQETFPSLIGAEDLYRGLMRVVDRSAVEVTARIQRGSLASYIALILITLLTSVGGSLLVSDHWPAGTFADGWGQVAVGVVVIAAAFLTATARGRVRAILLVGVTGYGTALLFLMHGAPDLGLTQVLVETVTLVVFLLIVRKLPKYFTERPLQSSRWLRIAVSVPVGALAAGLVYLAAGARTATPVSTAFPEAAYQFGYGKNIVNVILVDTRAWDTFGEISVLVLAATGVASLIFLRNRPLDLQRVDVARVDKRAVPWLLGSLRRPKADRSLIFEVGTRLLFGVIMVVAVYLLFAGHNYPGGGFAAGLVAGMGLMLRYLAAGREELNEAAPFPAGALLGSGLSVAALAAVSPVAFGGRVLQSYDLRLSIPGLDTLNTPFGPFTLLGDVHIVSSTLFDIGVFLVVLGVILDLVRSVGSGIDMHEESEQAPAPEPDSFRALPSARRPS
ncbi:Na+/H+ antiporter subunit A [Propionicicella superfundia]|uniref:Na+/H+ antiporter subunit A n=1 Tax=Propionicicella superfundia TaxID=348582 RepID=UPI0003F80005|nr:Na+/H+ antiporter subunit A [Propionicicella superfundia]